MAIYAGADLFLMPSRSEPCGLSQMIAMRYGTVPIVRETGGLKDTVQPYEAWRDAGNGFSFRNYASGDMLYVIREAVYLYKDYPDAFDRLRKRAMESDFSWARSARDYLRIYANITGQVWTTAQSQPEEPLEAEAAEEAVPAAEAAAAEMTAPTAEEQPAEGSAPVEEPVPAPAAEAPAEKPARRTARKPAAKKEPAAKKAPAKTAVRKAAARKTAAKEEPEELPVDSAIQEKPAKKTAAKKEKTTKKGPAKTKKEDAAE